MPKARFNTHWKKKWKEKTGEDFDGEFERETYWKKFRARAAFETLCEGKTKTGKPCQNLPEPGSRFCFHHGEQGE